MDINIPAADTSASSSHQLSISNLRQPSSSYNDPFTPHSTETEHGTRMHALLTYIWDNYLSFRPQIPVVLLGVGNSYLGIKQLLTTRDIKHRIPICLSFVEDRLRPVKSDSDPMLSSWYKSSSLIYVKPDHACFEDNDMARKVRKNRFGKVVQATGIYDPEDDTPMDDGRRAKRRRTEDKQTDVLSRIMHHYQKPALEAVLQKTQEWETRRGPLAKSESERSDEGGDEMEDELSSTVQPSHFASAPSRPSFAPRNAARTPATSRPGSSGGVMRRAGGSARGSGSGSGSGDSGTGAASNRGGEDIEMR